MTHDQQDHEIKHLNRQIPPEAHTAMYVWHKYWSRKTWNVVGEFIRTYCRQNGVVLDPFAGSGVVALEALRSHRRVIVCDFNPVASLITELTIRPIDSVALRAAYERVEAEVKAKVETLYEISCTNCGKSLIAECCVRVGEKLTEVRYPKCPHCGHQSIADKPSKKDVLKLNALEAKPVSGWYPKGRLHYPGSTGFMKKEKYESIDELFTVRNLQALAWIYHSIQSEKNALLRKFLMGAFTSMVHLCTRMMPVGNPQPTNHYTYFSSPGWTQHSYWSAPRYMEQNVWQKFESAVVGHQGLLNAKAESSQVIPKVRITSEWEEVLKGKADVAIITADCIKTMKGMPSSCVDYVFTDPPYDQSVQYGELSLLWNAWLKADANYGDKLIAEEVIHNERQGKSFDVYHGLLSNSFQECYRLLRPDSYLTLTFHNPTFKVRNATGRAAVFAGFDYQKIHHQPLGQRNLSPV